MKTDGKKKIERLYNTAERILFSGVLVVVAGVFVLDLIIEVFTAPWYRIVITGVFAYLFSFCAWKSLDFRPEYRVEEGGIWFRDEQVMLPYTLMERAEYCSFPDRSSTGYEVDIFISPAALLEGQINGQKIRKNLQKEKKIRNIFSEKEK